MHCIYVAPVTGLKKDMSHLKSFHQPVQEYMMGQHTFKAGSPQGRTIIMEKKQTCTSGNKDDGHVCIQRIPLPQVTG